MSEHDRTTYTPDRNLPWNYSVMPNPAPSKTPRRHINDIAFPANSASFDREGNSVCQAVAKYLADNPTVHVLVVGLAYRMETNGDELGLRRANAVKSALTKHGVAAERMETATFGSVFSKGDNDPPIPEDQQRRVEIWTLSD